MRYGYSGVLFIFERVHESIIFFPDYDHYQKFLGTPAKTSQSKKLALWYWEYKGGWLTPSRSSNTQILQSLSKSLFKYPWHQPMHAWELCVYACVCVCVCVHICVSFCSCSISLCRSSLQGGWSVTHCVGLTLAGSVLTEGRKKKHLEIQGSYKRGEGVQKPKSWFHWEVFLFAFCPMWVMNIHLDVQEKKAPPLANTGTDIWAEM